MSGSEVACIMQKITAEYQAGQRALRGLSRGVAQHRFITKRMENIGKLHQQLQTLVGDQAMPLIVQALGRKDQSTRDPAGKECPSMVFPPSQARSRESLFSVVQEPRQER
jgi:hypothetical protein